MSGICGIVNWDGKPVDPELLRKMADAAAYRGPDGINYWIEDNVGLAHLALHTTPESVREEQPLVNRRGDLVLVADARVDNRHELIKVLTAKGYLEEKDPTDADLIMAAYECWGEECPKEVVGDYAFAVWDTCRERLYCARDAIGVRPFVYCEDSDRFLFASSVSAILAALETAPLVNYPLLQDMIAGRFDRWVTETAYRTIFRLPQSYYLEGRSRGISLTRYWIIGTQVGPRYRSDEEYAEHFRELFTEAVRARVRSVGPVGVAVSGGLDSSAIACMVEDLIVSRETPIDGRLYSYVFDATPNADEREYVEVVIEACPHLEPTVFAGDGCWGLREFGSDNGYPLEEPELSVDRALFVALLRRLREDSCRTCLWGTWADQLQKSGVYAQPGMLRDVALADIPREIQHFWRCSHWASWRTYIPSIGLGLQRQLAHWAEGLGFLTSRELLSRVTEGGSVDRLPAPLMESRVVRAIYRELTSGLNSARFFAFDRATAYSGVEQRLPFLDRRLVDYVLRVPPRLFFRDGVTKYLLRHALRETLPEKILHRTGGAHITRLVERGLQEKEVGRVEELLEGTFLGHAGLVEQDRLVQAWASYRMDGSSHVRRVLIWALCVEAWLRYVNHQN